MPELIGTIKKRPRIAEFEDGVDIVGIARLTPHGASPWRGALTPPAPKEGELLQDVYHHPHDGCLVKVVDAAAFANREKIDFMRFKSTGAGSRKYPCPDSHLWSFLFVLIVTGGDAPNARQCRSTN